MKKIILILIVMCNIKGISQETLGFREFEKILHQGVSFVEENVIEINHFSFVEIKRVNDLILYLPVILNERSKDEDFGGYNSGGYILLYDTKKDCYFEIRVDRRGINLETKNNELYEIGAKLFYEFGEGYSIGIDITLITNKYNKYQFKMVERNNQIIINSKCIETKYCKVLTLNTNLDNLDMFCLIKEIYNLDFDKLYSKNDSFYWRCSQSH